MMQITIQIPDEIGRRLADFGVDLERRVLKGFALAELRAGRITERQLAEMLGLVRIQVDGFLKAHGVYQDYTFQDFELDRQALKEIGL